MKSFLVEVYNGVSEGMFKKSHSLFAEETMKITNKNISSIFILRRLICLRRAI